MNDFEEFREELRSALQHLHALNFQPSDILCQVTGCVPAEGAGPVQARIVAAIGEMAPGPDVPPDSRARRDFDALHLRFVLGLTQEETAERLHLSVRHVQRVQAEATHLLAQRLWQQGLQAQEAAQLTQAPDWRSQAELELASLETSDPQALTDVGEMIRAVLELGDVLASTRDVRVEAGFVQPNLVAAAHPSVLRQTLITAISRLAQHVSPGQMTIYATLEEGRVKITITGSVAAEHLPAGQDLISDIITPPETSVEVHQKGESIFLQVKVPSAGERIVLVVEDNLDMVHFYRRCTAGTTYRIVYTPVGQEIFDAIEANPPDIIILDVMMPDVDGWQLLTHLHERPSTRDIPVVVCSVVKEKELALALGAAHFLPKPIPPRQFVEALDQVARRVSEKASKAPENTVSAS
jgi:CheY-like chemotaxis protein/AraC-like DNA-binding protein